jgi:YXWGXW repeat-containing protein
MARWLSLSAAWLALGLSSACGSSLLTPETRAHPPTTRYIDVPYPPPAARAEIVPPKPRDGAVWVDGEWSWEGKQWTWQSGGWVMPPARAYFAPWIAFRRSDGKLVFAPGTWHRDDGQSLPRPIPVGLAQSSLEEENDAGPQPPDAGP